MKIKKNIWIDQIFYDKVSLELTRTEIAKSKTFKWCHIFNTADILTMHTGVYQFHI